MWRSLIMLVVLLGFVLLPAIGCTSVPNGSLSAVAPISDKPRVGNVYLVRGFIGVFSTGMDDLSKEISSHGIRSIVYQDAQTGELSKAIIAAYANKPDHEPLVLIGHSYGADDVVRISRDLNKHHIPVDLLVTFDPVVPGKVPDNVRLTLNYYKPQGALDVLPWLRGIPLEKTSSNNPGNLANINLATSRPDLLESGTNHFNIEKNHLIYSDLMNDLLEICPPRSNWAGRSYQVNSQFDSATAQRHLHPAPKATATAEPGTGTPATLAGFSSSNEPVAAPATQPAHASDTPPTISQIDPAGLH